MSIAPRSVKTWCIVGAAALVVGAAALTPGFLQIEVVQGRLVGAPVDVVLNGAPIVLLALGMCLVIATAGVDLSVGATMALAGIVTASLLRSNLVGETLAVAAALALGAASGAVVGGLVAFVRVPPVVASLVGMVALRGVAQSISSGQNIPLASGAIDGLANGSLARIPVPVVLAGGIAAAVWALCRWSILGAWVSVVGSSPEASRRAGVPWVRTVTLAYAACGTLAALAGLLVCSDIRGADPNSVGIGLELDAILAVVIGGGALAGGPPRVLGAVVGALLMQTVTVLVDTWGIPPGAILVTKALAAVGACWIMATQNVPGAGR